MICNGPVKRRKARSESVAALLKIGKKAQRRQYFSGSNEQPFDVLAGILKSRFPGS